MILLSTSSLSWYWIHRILLLSKKAWFDWIDLCLNYFDYDLWDWDYIKSLCELTWIKVLSITAPSKWLNEEIIDDIVSLSKKLGAQIINFSPPYFKDINASWFAKHLIKVKSETKISISIKNVEPEFLLLVIPKYKNSSLLDIKKITWDTSLDLSIVDNWVWLDIIHSHKLLWTSLKNIYLSDKDWALPWYAWWWISNFPLESFLMKLKTTAYNWFISLKVNPDDLWVWNEELLLQNLSNIIEYYKKYYLNYK